MANLIRNAEFILNTEAFFKAISDGFIVEKEDKLFLCLKEETLVPIEPDDFGRRRYITGLDNNSPQLTVLNFIPTNDYSYCDVYFFLMANHIPINNSFYTMNENDSSVSIYIDHGELIIRDIQSVIYGDDTFFALTFKNNSLDYVYRTEQTSNLVISITDSKVFGDKNTKPALSMLITKNNYIDLYSEIKSFFLHRLGKLPKDGVGIYSNTIVLE